MYYHAGFALEMIQRLQIVLRLLHDLTSKLEMNRLLLLFWALFVCVILLVGMFRICFVVMLPLREPAHVQHE